MLDIKKVTVQYERADPHALRDVTFSVAAGERVALMGANGAGKSTLLLTLLGVLPLSSGTVQVNGIPLEKKNLRALRREAGLLFQNPDDQLFMPTVFEDAAFGPRSFGVPEEDIEARVDTALAQLEIVPLKQRMTHKLSGGEKRMVALAGLLAVAPSVLLMDEPTAFLDPAAARRLAGILNGLPQTMLIATHDLSLVRAVCGRVILMKDGALFADLPADEALRNEELLFACGL